MSRPLNDDDTIPMKRHIQLALRVVEGERSLVLEVHQDIKPKWTVTDEQVDGQTDDSSMSQQDIDATKEQVYDSLVTALTKAAVLAIPNLVDTLIKRARHDEANK